MFGKRVLRGGIGKVVIYPSFFSNSVIILNQDFDMSKQGFFMPVFYLNSALLSNKVNNFE